MPKDEWMDLALMGLGAGLKGTVTGLIGRFLPSLSADIGGIVAGGLMYEFGDRVHPFVQKIGAGILIASIGGLVAGMVPSLGGAPAASAGTTTTATSSLEALASATSQQVVTS